MKLIKTLALMFLMKQHQNYLYYGFHEGRCLRVEVLDSTIIAVFPHGIPFLKSVRSIVLESVVLVLLFFGSVHLVYYQNLQYRQVQTHRHLHFMAV